MMFNDHGVLPPGDHPITLTALRKSFLVEGNSNLIGWARLWREQLVENLSFLVHQLWEVGIDEIYLDGSFTTDKLRPGDIDGVFVCPYLKWIRELQPALNSLDRRRRATLGRDQTFCPVWDFSHASRRRDTVTGKPKPLMWHAERIELFPHHPDWPDMGLNPDFFRYARPSEGGYEKGLLKLLRGDS